MYPDAATIADAVIDRQTKSEGDDIRFEISGQLDMLAELQAGQDAMRLKKQELIDKLFTPQIRLEIADIEAEFADKEATLSGAIAKLTKDVKDAVEQFGDTVKGQHLQAVYRRGSDLWDSTALMRLAKRFPDIWDAHKQGKASVAIRKV